MTLIFHEQKTDLFRLQFKSHNNEKINSIQKNQVAAVFPQTLLLKRNNSFSKFLLYSFRYSVFYDLNFTLSIN